MRLSFVEILAVTFAAVAALASAAQAFLTYEERGEVARAIIFAERIDACVGLLSAVEPLVAKATPQWRERIAASESEGARRPAVYYFPQGTAGAAFETAHRAMLDKWERAKAAYLIVMPAPARERVAFFDRILTEDIVYYNNSMSKSEFVAWLEALDAEAEAIAEDCRSLV